jgi:RNA polymerase sigma-70 factor (ECF subfamily)
MSEDELVAAARAGDEDAFGRLVAPYRTELMVHCYRTLGSLHDAEDALQEALLRAWRGLTRFEGRSSVRSWLYTIATNVCLSAIERRSKRVLPVDYGPAAADPHGPLGERVSEAVWIEPYPDEELGPGAALAGPDARYEQRESVELAFIAALQHLPARQRAALILRDVLGFTGAEVAAALDTSTDAIHSALQRAHRTIDKQLPQRTQQATLRSLGDKRLREIVGSFVDAWERGDVDALVARLAHDAVFTMPPVPTWYRGREMIASFLRARPLKRGTRWRVVPTRANGQLAFGHYEWDEVRAAFLPDGIIVLTLDGEEISQLTAFREPRLFPRFGLPPTRARAEGP